jgi:hypothetical protein
VLRMPRRWSWDVSVAVDTWFSCARTRSVNSPAMTVVVKHTHTGRPRL